MSNPMTTASASIKLKHGYEMPLVGYGTYLCSSSEAEAGVTYALSIGYRHIDTAEYYNNHEGIANAIIKSNIPRSEIFITDKLNPWKDYLVSGKSYNETIESFHTQRTRLKTDYVDLYLIHSAFCKDTRIDQYKALLDLQKQGYIHEIGVSNWNISHLNELIAANLPLPAVNQIEIHPLCTQVKLIKYMRENGVEVQAYSSLAPLDSWRIDPGHSSSKTNEDAAAFSHAHEVIKSLALKYNVSESQILLKWCLQHNYPILPKSTKPDRIKLNIDLFGFELSLEDVSMLDSLDQDRPFAWPEGNPLNCP